MNPLLKRRVRAFKKMKRSYFSLIALGILFLLSFFCEFIANDHPLIVHYRGTTYFPVMKVYKNLDFGWEGEVEPHYKEILPALEKDGWVLKPLIFWGSNESNNNPG